MTVFGHVLDVGDGGCSILRDSQTNGAVVIDVKTWSSLQDAVLENGIDRVSTLILTHLDRDHCEGALGLIGAGSIPVDRVIVNPDLHGWCVFGEHRTLRKFLGRGKYQMSDKDLASTLSNMIAAETSRRAPSRFQFTKYRGSEWTEMDLVFRVLWPEASVTTTPRTFRQSVGSLANRNNLSLVVKVESATVSAIFAGDCEAQAISASIDEFSEDWSCDVLVWPHHGGHSRKSGSSAQSIEDAKRLLDETQPRDVVFQNGRGGRWHTPLYAVAEAVAEAGVDVCCSQISKQCGTAPSDSQMCGGAFSFSFDDNQVVTQRGGIDAFAKFRRGLKSPACRSTLAQ